MEIVATVEGKPAGLFASFSQKLQFSQSLRNILVVEKVFFASEADKQKE
jgi:hypothetical protein